MKRNDYLCTIAKGGREGESRENDDGRGCRPEVLSCMNLLMVAEEAGIASEILVAMTSACVMRWSDYRSQ